MRYIVRFYGKHKLIYTILILLLAISGTLLECVINEGSQLKKTVKQEHKKSDHTACQLAMAEALPDVDFYEYMEEDSKEFGKFQRFYEELQNDSTFTYIVQSEQPLEVYKPVMQKIFLDGYEQGEPAEVFTGEDGEKRYVTKTLQISANFLKQDTVAIQKGKAFDKNMYHYSQGECVPVILGNAYQKFFELGDILEADYLFENMQFKVVGFLSEKAFFYSTQEQRMKSLERYILMPAFSDLPENDFGKRAALQYFSSYIISKNDSSTVLKRIQKIEEKNQIDPANFNLIDQNSSEEEMVNIFEMYSAMTDAVSEYFESIIWIMIVCIGVILSTVLTNMIREENYNFGIYLMCGMHRYELMVILFRMDMLIVGIGDLFVLWAAVVNSISVRSILQVQLVLLFVLLVSFAACCMHLWRMDISKLTGGGE